MTNYIDEQFKRLRAPFPAKKVSFRVGATYDEKDSGKKYGIALAYIDARDLYERLDTVIGPAHWQIRYPFAGYAEIGIKIGEEWIWKGNGAGETDIEGVKGQFSDAAKRAGVTWGIAAYLYDMPNVWFELELNRNGKVKGFLDEKAIIDRFSAWQDKYFEAHGGA